MSKLMLGWAEESLVPEKKVPLAGQFYERISQYVYSPITATACALECGGQEAILVSVDIVSMQKFLIDEIRCRFAELCPEVDPEKLILFATHTHTAMEVRPIAKTTAGTGLSAINRLLEEFFPAGKLYTAKTTEDDSVMSREEAGHWVAEQVALAAKRAWDNRREALYANEFGRAAVGMCRRVSYDDGSAKMWGDTNTANFVAMEGGNDSGVELLYTFDPDRNLTGVWANIACPAQILEQRSFISADYWGEVKKILRSRLGENIHVLGMCAAAGDQCPRDLIRWVDPETPIDDPNVSRPNLLKRRADPSMYDISGCQRVGKRIANEILCVLEEITEYHAEPIFCHETVRLNLPLRKATPAQHAEAVERIEHYVEKNRDKESFDYSDTAKLYVYAGTIKRFREQQLGEVVPIEYHVLRLGDICLTTNPFELFLDYGNRIRARSYARQTFIAQLCCDSLGYLPTEKAEKAGHYSAYISSGCVGHEGGDLLVRDTLARINAMFPPEA